MMKRLFGIMVWVAFGVQIGHAACNDTTINLTSPFDPTANASFSGTTTTFNNYVNNCADAAISITLRSTASSLRLTKPITINRGSGKTITLTSEQGSGGAPITLEDTVSNTRMITATTQVTLKNINFSRTVSNRDTASVQINGANSVISDCNFLMSDNVSTATSSSLISVGADLVLIERCVFRAPVTDAAAVGRTLAIVTTSSSGKVEVRSCLFVSTGLLLQKESLHLFANTFVGSRNRHSPVVFLGGTGAASPSQMAISNNLFANKIDTLPPVFFETANASWAGLKVVRNAYASSLAAPQFAKSASAAQAFTAASGVNANVLLPRGFSNYADAATAKDYPVYQMRSDAGLNPANADFGKIPDIFNGFPAATPAITGLLDSIPSFFPSVSFSPLASTSPWSAGNKVGAFNVYDTRVLPSPVDSLAFQKASDTTDIKLTELRFNSAYYGKFVAPQTLYFFFAGASASLASNDTAALIASLTAANVVRKSYPMSTGADSLFDVPKAVRTGGNVFVKVLHFNANGQAHVLGANALVSVTGIPRYPVNDLALSVISTPAELAAGLVNISLGKGSEADSARVIAYSEAGAAFDSTAKRLPTALTSFSFDFATRGRQKVRFAARPFATSGGTVYTGNLTALSSLVDINKGMGDTVFVSIQASCPGAVGDANRPFCSLDSAVALLDTAGSGGQIIILKTSGPIPSATIKGNGTSEIIIQSQTSSNFDARGIFAGTSATPALVIQRKNVVINRMAFEMPAASTAPAVRVESTANPVKIDGNLFRPANAATSVAGGAAIALQSFAGQADIFNNVIWGYAAGIQAANSSGESVRIFNNSFFEDKAAFPTGSDMTAIKFQGTAFTASISSNFFNEVKTPYEATLSGSAVKLSNNVYSVGSGALVGLTEVGGRMDNVASVATVSLYGDALKKLSDQFTGSGGVLDCTTFRPCNSLLAGSSDLANSALAADFFGVPRRAKAEVGAIEYVMPTENIPRGYLTIKALGVAKDPTRARIVIASRNVDSSLADSALFWYGTTANASPGSNKQVLALSALSGSGDTLDVTGLEGQRTYYFFAAFLKVASAIPGASYTASLTTGQIKVTSPDVVDISKVPGVLFPDPNGVFTQDTGSFSGWEGTLGFSDTVKMGTVCAPSLSTASSTAEFDAIPSSPRIRICIENDSLGKTGSNLVWALKIKVDSSKFGPTFAQNMDSAHLFAFPSQGLPTYMPSWSVTKDNAGDYQFEINGQFSGTYDLQFGDLPPAKKAGTLAAATSSVLDYRSNAASLIPVSFQGTGFLTANPLIIATPIPAGGMAEGEQRPFVLTPTGNYEYFAKSPVISRGMGGMDQTRAITFLADYFARAVEVDSTTGSSNPSVKKPFNLKAGIGNSNLEKVLDLAQSDLTVDNAGGMNASSVTLKLDRLAKDRDKGGDKASRGLEVVFTVFDGGKISHSNAFIQTYFSEAELTARDKNMGYARQEFEARKWNLFSYPWDEDLNGQVQRVVGDSVWSPKETLIYRYKGSGTGSSAYEAYSGVDNSSFVYDSCRALWSAASIRPYTARSSFGKSLDFQPFSLTVSPGSWTLFGLPFNFQMRWRDIVNASTPAPANVWRFERVAQQWQRLDQNSVVYPWDGLAINEIAATTLVFPVLDSSRSALAVAKQAQPAKPVWAARIEATNATASMVLRIGRSEVPGIFSEAPGVPGQNFRVALATEKGLASEAFLPPAESLEGSWALSLRGLQGKTPDVQLSLHKEAGDMPFYLVEAVSQSVTPLEEGKAISLPTENAESKEYHLVAGEGAVSQALRGVNSPYMLRLGNFPNPFQGLTRIRYDLPSLHDAVQYSLRIHDSKGRVILSQSLSGGSRFDFLWDGKDGKKINAPAGQYHMTLEARVPSGTVFRAHRILLKL